MAHVGIVDNQGGLYLSPAEMALWLLQDFGGVREADAFADRRYAKARRGRRGYWGEVSLFVHRYSRVRSEVA